MYTAREAIMAPGTSVFGYRRGHEVPPEVVESWELTVGPDGQVVEGPLTEESERLAQTPPSEADTRVTWEAWAVANGMSAEDAENATMDDLQAIRPAEAVTEPERPADSAKKAEWVDYVVARAGDDEQLKIWARDDATTKANLQAWEPGAVTPGDTVAVAATEANQA